MTAARAAGERRIQILSVAAFAPLWLLVPLLSFGHAPRYPKSIVVAVTPTRVVVSTRVEVALGDRARMLRSLFDANRSGVIDQAEKALIETYLAERATRSLLVMLNGKRVSFEEEARAVVGAEGRVDEPTSVVLSVALVSTTIRLRRGENWLRVGDAAFERANDVPVALSVGASAKVVTPPKTVLDARGDSFTFRFVCSGHSE